MCFQLHKLPGFDSRLPHERSIGLIAVSRVCREMDLLDDDSARKIVIIGPEKAGKTTYISRYVHGVYLPDEAYRKTIGGKQKVIAAEFSNES